MADMFIDRTAAFLTKVLDGSSLRQSVLADNIANADTPGYTRKEVSFEDQLREAANRAEGDPDQQVADIAGIQLSALEDDASPRRADGNNVNMEREMTLEAKNSLQYDTAADMLTANFRMLKLAIHEGRS
ncbi:MAG TPA: flagellar basal body rod protein FlgB [Armatimonadota bacterium]|nr:flagellar basal body rod protein FlgB [Armatimonadota bacterium]